LEVKTQGNKPKESTSAPQKGTSAQNTQKTSDTNLALLKQDIARLVKEEQIKRMQMQLNKQINQTTEQPSQLDQSSQQNTIVQSSSPSTTVAPQEPGTKKKRAAKRACVNCRINHASCDDNRPCQRCVRS